MSPQCDQMRSRTTWTMVPAAGTLLLIVMFSGCGANAVRANSNREPVALTIGPDQNLARPVSEDGQWVMASKDYTGTRYSGLNEINIENVKNLKLAWTFSTGTLRGHEAAPLIVNNAMYIVTPLPNFLYALDLKNGVMKWVYKPGAAPAAAGVACCDIVNRGGAYFKGKIYYNTLDNFSVAVDAQTGKQIWKTQLGDINKGETMTMAPIVVKAKVLVGNSGGEMGVRGWLTALDADTGKIAWRAYSSGPDKDVLIGSNFKPFYAQDRGKDLGVTSWPGDAWKIGGGTVWGWITYDPGLDLIYYGTANPGPWNPDVRPGDNKWTCTIFARHPETGEAVWAYQLNPHDGHDYDGVNENVLVDLPIGGVTRKVLLHPDRNGRMYVIDRSTGEVISAETFAYTTTNTGVDRKTGRIQVAKDKIPGFGKTIRDICPASAGGKDWQPSAFSFKTGLLYLPGNNLCQEEQGLQPNYIMGTPYVGVNVRMYAGPGGHRGEFTAWDPVAAKRVWSIQERFPVWSGSVVTAGDVAFYGTMDGWFKAVNARTGAPLWQFKAGSGIIGQPVTYKGVDGKQYVAVLSGVGGWAGAIVAGDADPRDGTAALGFVNAMQDLPQYTNKGGMLYVFSL